MKIEIDLKDILQDDDYGSETLQESIRRQVTDKLTKQISEGIGKKIDEEISKAIEEQIKKALDEIRPDLITEIMDAEYIQIDRYGSRDKIPTSFRKQLIKTVNENMVYQPNKNWDSEKNSFTKAVDSIISKQVDVFKKQFDELIDKQYIETTKAYAIKVLKEKLGF